MLNHNNSSLGRSFNGKCLVGMKFFARATPHHYLLWLLSILYNLLEEPGNVLRIPNYIQPCNDTCQRLNIWHSKLEMKTHRKERFTESEPSLTLKGTHFFVCLNETNWSSPVENSIEHPFYLRKLTHYPWHGSFSSLENRKEPYLNNNCFTDVQKQNFIPSCTWSKHEEQRLAFFFKLRKIHLHLSKLS